MSKNKYYVICDINDNVLLVNSFEEVQEIKLTTKLKEIKSGEFLCIR